MTEKTEAALPMEEFVTPTDLKHPIAPQHSPLRTSAVNDGGQCVETATKAENHHFIDAHNQKKVY